MDLINKELFWSRVEHIFESWENNSSGWGEPGVECFTILIGNDKNKSEDEDEVLYSKTLSIMNYVFDITLMDTAMVFCKKSKTLFLRCANKVKSVFEVVGDESPKGIKLVMTPREGKEKESLDAQYIVDLINGLEHKRVGMAVKDKVRGNFATTCLQYLQSKFEIVDVANGINGALLYKDASALKRITTSSKVASTLMKKYGHAILVELAASNHKLSHMAISSNIENKLEQSVKLVRVDEDGEELDAGDFEVAYNPIIQSNTYDARASAEADEKILQLTTVTCSIGVRYKMYCANIARTFFFVKPADEKLMGVRLQAYEHVVNAFEIAKKAFVAGEPVSNVYTQVAAYLDAQELMKNKLFRNVGSAIGLEFRDSMCVLNDKVNAVITPNTTYNLNIFVTDLVDENGTPFAVQLSDTIAFTDKVHVLTDASLALDDVLIMLKEEVAATRALSTRAKEVTVSSANKEELRREQQIELAKNKCQEALATLSLQNDTKDGKVSTNSKDVSISYHNLSDITNRESLKPSKVTVDSRNSTILCPVNGQLVPFHISMLKNVMKVEEGQYFYLRLVFHVPDANGKLPEGAIPGSMFVKELSYRTKGNGLQQAFINIQSLKKESQVRLKTKEMQEQVPQQEPIRINKDSTVRLRDVQVRPNITKAKKVFGTLTAHFNGLRYITTDRSYVDINYSSIKSVFLQRADKKSTTVMIHFQFRHPILITKSKHSEYLQFFVQIGEGVHDVDTAMFDDDDEARQEEEEREKRKKNNEKFAFFAKSLEQFWKEQCPHLELEFEVPTRKAAFTGVTSREMVDLIPTENCLVALEDKMPFVLHINEVEIVSLERVAFSLREFDMAIIYKGLTKPVTLITSIPSKSIDTIKDWLYNSSILYYESAANINWKDTLAVIRKDLTGFYEAGGWATLWEGDEEVDDEDDEEEEEAAAPGAPGAKSSKKAKPQDDDLSGSDFELENSASESSDDYSSDGSDDEDTEASGSDEAASEGEDWETLERKAGESDRKRERED